jgi:hypothetical protein
MSQSLEGNTFDLLKTASGTMLDLGPGTGTILYRFDPALVTKVYGAEPAVAMRPTLQKNIEKAGLLRANMKFLPAAPSRKNLFPL